MQGALFSHSLPCSPKMQFIGDSESKLAASKALKSFCLSTTLTILNKSPEDSGLPMGLGILTQVLIPVPQMLLSPKPTP